MGMSPHKRAWAVIKSCLFGDVCEITSKPNWGFKKDKNDIRNVTVDEFIEHPFYSDTILLHILAGEGVRLGAIETLVPLVYDNCVRLVAIEHNPESDDWCDDSNVGHDRLQVMLNAMSQYKDEVHTVDLGRNLVFTMTTVYPLELPELCDKFYAESIDRKWATLKDKGTDRPNLVYTHTSESLLPDKSIAEIPGNLRCTWVIGGQWYLEIVPKLKSSEHHLIDSVLLQVIFARYVIEDDREDGVFVRKMGSLFDVGELKRMADEVSDYVPQGGNPKHWRNVIKDRSKYRGIKKQISSIRMCDLRGLRLSGELVYTSTVCPPAVVHLFGANYVISSVYPPRDLSVLYPMKGRANGKV